MLRTLAAGLLVVVTLAACGGAATPTSTPGVTPTPRPTPTAVPGNPGTGVTDPGSGGGSDPNPGGGIVIPGPGGGANDNPLLGAATYVKPAQGLVNLRTVNVQLVRALVNADGSVTADLRWWSGVAPCSALDHVELVRDDATKTIRLKVVEGSGAGDVGCIDIAQLSATTVDLGALATGTWAISAEGDAPAIKLDVP
jgi:hypothetical protein